MKEIRLLALLMMVGMTFTISSFASEKSSVTEKLLALFPHLSQITVEYTDAPGVYKFWVGADVNFVSVVGDHLIIGELYNTKERTKLSQRERYNRVKRSMENLSEEEVIVFKAKEEKRYINIFTDADCPYCQRIHQEIPVLNKSGVTVRYIAFPVYGRDIAKHQSIWCADDQVQAITAAKSGLQLNTKRCDINIDKTLKIGFDLGFKGTPNIVYDDGTISQGYRPADAILRDMQLTRN